MDAQKGKVFKLVFLLFLGFMVYYAYSVYRGSIQMADYDVAKFENEKKIKTLDSVIALVDEKGFTEEELNDFAISGNRLIKDVLLLKVIRQLVPGFIIGV